MTKPHLAFILITALCAAAPLRAGVKVSSDEAPATNVAPPAATPPAPEPATTTGGKRVAFVTADSKYLTANTSGVVDASGLKLGSKQTFTLVDLNGGEWADGDEIKIAYIPNTGGVPDPSKTSYWRDNHGSVKRGKEAGVFKLKKQDKKFALQTDAGKYLTATLTEGSLSFSDKAEDALFVEIVEVTPKPKK
jgi:hypothetical protein